MMSPSGRVMTRQVLVCLLFLCVLHLLLCFCPHTLLISINDKSYLWNICLSVHLSISQHLRPCRWRCWTCLLRSTRLITASCSYCVISMHHMTTAVRRHLDQLSNASGILDCRQRPYVYKRNPIQIQLHWLKVKTTPLIFLTNLKYNVFRHPRSVPASQP